MCPRILLPAVSAAFLAVGCAPPSRDNPWDPVNAPRAALVVVGPSGGNVGSHADTFLLDASGSVDPNGNALGVTFDLDGSGAFATPAVPCAEIPEQPVACWYGRLDMPPSPTLSGDLALATRPLAARVIGGGDADTYASADAVITNAAPQVRLGSEMFVPLTVDGSSPFSVLLSTCGTGSGCVTDPDDSEADLQWTWSQTGGPTVTPQADASLPGAQRFDSPTTSSVFSFEAAADDGIFSRSDRLRVFAASPLLVAAGSPQRVFEVHPEFNARQVNTNGRVHAIALDPLATPEAQASFFVAEWAAVGGGVGLVTRLAQDLQQILDQWQVGTDSSLTTLSLASTGDGGACAAREVAGAWAFLMLRPGSVELTAASPNGERAVAVFPRLDGLGCWALTATSVYSLSLGGAITPVATNAFTGMTGHISTQPADGSIWVASRAGSSPRLLRIDVDGTVTTITTSVTLVDALAPDPDGGVFAHSSTTKRFVRVAPDGTVTSLDGPPIQCNDTGGGLPQMAFDPGDQTLYVIDRGTAHLAAFRKEGNVLIAGAVATVTDVTLNEATVVDSFTQILFEPRRRQVFVGVHAQNDTLVVIDGYVALLPLHFRRFTFLPLPAPGLLAGYEPTRGSLWSASQSVDGTGVSNAVRRIADDGTVLAAVAGLLAPFDVEPLPDGGAWIAAATTTSGTPVATRLLRVAGDAGIVTEGTLPLALGAISIWQDENTLCAAVTTTSTTAALARIDLGTMTSEPLTYTRVSGAAIVPIAAAGGSCWFVEKQVSLGLAKLVRFDAGSQTSAFAPISSVDGVGWRIGGGATDPRDGSLWVSDVSGGRVLHMASNGTRLTSWAVGAGANGPTVRATASGGLEVWWVVNLFDTSEVHRSPDGASPTAPTLVVTLPYTSIFSMEVLSP